MLLLAGWVRSAITSDRGKCEIAPDVFNFFPHSTFKAVSMTLPPDHFLSECDPERTLQERPSKSPENLHKSEAEVWPMILA